MILINKLQLAIFAWSSYCITIWGWRKLGLAAILGAASVVSLPPIGFFLILLVTMPSLIWLLDGAIDTSLKQQTKGKQNFIIKLFARIYAARSAFAVGMAFGFGYFFAGLYWIGSAFFAENNDFILLMPFATILLPLLLSIYWALACLLARIFWSGSVRNVFTVAICLSIFEFLRGTLFTGLPWNLMGFAFDFSTALLQSAAIWGIYGLTFIVILFSSAFSLFANASISHKKLSISLVLCISVLFAGGSIRLSMNPTQYHDNVKLRLVQGNISQADKWRPEMRSIIANRYLELSGKKSEQQILGIDQVTHLIWPESAMPFLLEPNSSFMREAIDRLADGAYLITGAIRKHTVGNKVEFFNAILAFDSNGNQLGKYDKHHLVPFGEYLPHGNLLKKFGLSKLISMKDDFSRGIKASNIYLKNTPSFGANICYEVIFSAKVVERLHRPEWMLNITNDAWFGKSIGPYQHLAQARMRAIEEGLPMVRNANTGISAIFDPLGRLIASIPLGKTDVLDSALPLKVEPTFYVILASFI